MLTWQKYDEKVDLWSVGCIFAGEFADLIGVPSANPSFSEMLEGKPLFPGKDRKY
jgi:p38 MAP kinase